MTPRISSLALAALTCFGTTGAVHAATVSQTVALPEIIDGFSYDETVSAESHFTETLITGLARFDGSLGTLTGISMGIAVDNFDYQLDISAEPDNPDNVFSADYTSSFTDLEIVYNNSSDGFGYVLSDYALPDAVSCSDDGGAGSCFDSAGESGPWNDGGDFTGNAEFADFFGSGDVDALEIWWVAYEYAVTSDNVAFVSGNASLDLALGDLGTGSNTFTLTYEFTPVPLPASLFLLAPAAMLLMRRREV